MGGLDVLVVSSLVSPSLFTPLVVPLSLVSDLGMTEVGGTVVVTTGPEVMVWEVVITVLLVVCVLGGDVVVEVVLVVKTGRVGLVVVTMGTEDMVLVVVITGLLVLGGGMVVGVVLVVELVVVLVVVLVAK